MGFAFSLGSFFAGAVVCLYFANKDKVAAVEAQRKSDEFYYDFLAKAALRSAYSLAWRLSVTQLDVANSVYKRAKEGSEEALEAAERFLNESASFFSDIEESIESVREECKRDLTPDECNTVKYYHDWSERRNKKLEEIKQLIALNSTE